MNARRSAGSLPLLLPPLLRLLLPLLPLLLGARLALAGDSAAQPATPTVVVTASRAEKIRLAKERIIGAWARMASSCSFLDSDDDLTSPAETAYLSDFALADELSDLADAGAATTAAGRPARRTRGARLHTRTHDAGASSLLGPERMPGPSGGCQPGDHRLMAGRTAIVLHDTSLAEGYAAYDRKDYARALERFGTAWDKVGYDEAALMLARMHLDGLGTPRDTGQAIRWFERVADGRFDPWYDRLRFNPARPHLMTPHIEAAIALARIHERGIGVAPDRKQADAWYARAADYGFVPALDILGRNALSGAGGRRDPQQALARFREAADAGYAPAQYHLARMLYAGDGVARDLNLAGALFEAAARAGLPAAMAAAGRMLERGESAAPDPAKAIVYFKDAALKGDRDARFDLGRCFYRGIVVGRDLASARGWFDVAARQGQPEAMVLLAAMMASGEGGAQDRAGAYAWLGRAAQAGQEQAGAARRALAASLTPEERARADAESAPAPAP